ncbi:tyrosine-type recombinase/integrase [Pandoraea sp. XJJ-1]|uniref:tyrosine-type recombinase/integrase n=1 Tax=Pandoraea sp. XJJ-1 TaxID=3002643 RepID=UPI0022811F57|nr:tyrosine-type recombinase/integrase [Pandoraea sp. XJJ-1]WAL80999.1 tyrosine-type recombinase/integrase [Pandoraea sp. XJJ-1]
MNAKRRTTGHGLPTRVYKKFGSFHWYRPDGKWIKLCRIDEGETRMLERVAEEKRKEDVNAGAGNLPKHVDAYMDRFKRDYAETYRNEWVRRGEVFKTAFRDWDVDMLDAATLADWLADNWGEKLPAQRAMKAWIQKFFSWCIAPRRLVSINPCREITVKKPKVRTVYIPHADFLAIRSALLIGKRHRITGVEAKTPTGDMMQCFVDLCYLTLQRSTEIRSLTWQQVDEKAGVIHFLPSKTEDSSGLAVDWPITPEIDAVLKRARKLEPASVTYVIRDRRGNAKSDQSCRDAWEGAMERAGLGSKPYTIKDIRAKAMTDAKRSGYKIDELQIAGAHTDRSTTEGYIKARDIPTSSVRIALPDAEKASNN